METTSLEQDQRRVLLQDAFQASLWVSEPAGGIELAVDAPRVLSELRALALATSKGLEEVAGLGIAARSVLDDLRAAALVENAAGDVEAVYAPLLALANEAEASKVVQLETEAVHIDSLLEVRSAALSLVASVTYCIGAPQRLAQRKF